MQPIIGVLGVIDDERAFAINYPYIQAIEQSGGVPILLPYTENEQVLSKYIQMCNGFFFTGGKDIEPIRYGEEQSKDCGIVQKHRDALEFALFERAFATQKAILGVCRGCQVINVALGGTLYQDIPSQYKTTIAHRQTQEKHLPSHSVSVVVDTPLYALINDETRMQANSFHHQAIKTLGKGLKSMAYADDGIIEGIYHTEHRYLRGYQWHPERLYDSDKNNRLLFDDFIKACSL